MKKLLILLPLLFLLSCAPIAKEAYLKVDNLQFTEGLLLTVTSTHGEVFYATGEPQRVKSIYAVLRIANNSNNTVLITYTPDDHIIRSVDILGD